MSKTEQTPAADSAPAPAGDKQKINLQHVLLTYSIHDANYAPVFFVVIPCDTGVEYAIKCGGCKKARFKYVTGYAFPLLLKHELPLTQYNDHVMGCDRLDWDTEPDLVNKYIRIFTSVRKSVFLDPNISISIDTDRKEELMEGYIPITIKGTCSSGPRFPEPVKAVLVTGNCV
jgi:hypothetical protein